MLMMKIQMNAEKLDAEKRYDPAVIGRTIDAAFGRVQLRKMSAPDGTLVYCDTGDARDYARFGQVVNALKKQPWFMDNVALWRMYDSSDSETPGQYDEEDLLLHYRRRA